MKSLWYPQLNPSSIQFHSHPTPYFVRLQLRPLLWFLPSSACQWISENPPPTYPSHYPPPSFYLFVLSKDPNFDTCLPEHVNGLWNPPPHFPFLLITCLSPVRTQTLIPAFLSLSMVSGTPSCNLSSMPVAPVKKKLVNVQSYQDTNLSKIFPFLQKFLFRTSLLLPALRFCKSWHSIL